MHERPRLTFDFLQGHQSNYDRNISFSTQLLMYQDIVSRIEPLYVCLTALSVLYFIKRFYYTHIHTVHRSAEAVLTHTHTTCTQHTHSAHTQRTQTETQHIHIQTTHTHIHTTHTTHTTHPAHIQHTPQHKHIHTLTTYTTHTTHNTQQKTHSLCSVLLYLRQGSWVAFPLALLYPG
jgi:hypothetical protein